MTLTRSPLVRVLTVTTLAFLAVALGAWFVAGGQHDEFATLSGHTGGVFSLALAPDGTTVATGGGDGTVRLWTLANQRQRAVLKGHTGRVHAVAWSPDGATLATGGEDKSIRLWNANTGEEITVWAQMSKPIRGLAISRDGKTLAAAVDRDVHVWQLNNRHEQKVLSGHRQFISGLAFLPGGLELATFASDKTVRIWDVTNGRQLASMPGPFGHCYGLVVSTDGKTIACVGGGRVHLYDARSRQALEPVEPGAHILCGAAISPDGRLLAIGSQDHVVVLWDIQAKKELARLSGHDFAVGQMAFLPDGKTLVTSSHDSTLKLWKVD